MSESESINDKKIPIVIGIVGHRDVDLRFQKEIENKIDDAIKNIKEISPNSPLVVLTGLAKGADQIAAKIAIQNGAKLYIALPMNEEDYLNNIDFTFESKENYFKLKNDAIETFVVPDTEKQDDNSRSYKFRQQAIYVATHCHILLALWDENDDFTMSTGCGTTEAIHFALFQNYFCNDQIELHTPYDGFVLEILTPQKKNKINDEKNITITSKYLMADFKENNRYCVNTQMPNELKDILIKTDIFNENSENYQNKIKSNNDDKYLIEKCEYDFGSRKCRRISDIYNIASDLAQIRKDRFLFAIKYLATAGLLLLIFYTIYDLFIGKLTIILGASVFLLIIISYIFIDYISGNRRTYKKRKIKNFNSHTKFVEYRALAETLRVQYYLTAYNVNYDAGKFFFWSQKNEIAWVKKAVSTLLIGESIEVWEQEEIKKNYSNYKPKIVDYHDRNMKGVFEDRMFCRFVGFDKTFADSNNNGQVGYHKMNIEKKCKQLGKYNFFKKLFFSLTLFIYISLFVTETINIISSGNVNLYWIETTRIVLKIFLCIGIASTFLISYRYGKMSIERNLSDSKNMLILYSVAIDRVLDIFKDEKLNNDQKRKMFESYFKKVALEALIENGAWIAYNKENNITFPL
ncbi:MAG: hypothetical protein J1F32_01265 [Erysipelotrichales bacterium]|nr:hypothetical protein [Erysipelotrichales bacterium]